MERWDINCYDCGKYILTEEKEYVGADIKPVAGSHENGYYDEIADLFYCKECAKKRGMINGRDVNVIKD